MATTTAKLIRQQQASLISALTPGSLSGVAFEEYDLSELFEDWADTNAGACLRLFYIEDQNTYEVPLISDGATEQVETDFAVQVAYPKDSRYGSASRNDTMDIIEADRLQIDYAIGLCGSANYVSGQNGALATGHEVLEQDNSWILSINYRVTFSRATS